MMKKSIFKNIILVLLVALGVVCLCCCTSGKKTPEVTTTEYHPYDDAETVQVVIRGMNLEEGAMSFQGVKDSKPYELLFNEGANLYNKYGDVMTEKSLQLGQVVDLTYNTKNRKVLDIRISEDAWEVRDISGFSIDRVNHKTTILNQSYTYDDDVVVVSGDGLISVGEVCKEDLVVARGVKGKLCSVVVEQGHGYVRLKDYDTYIGGMIEIGYDTIVPVTDDMLITVREGTYKLKITKGEHSGYKNIVVEKDLENVVSLQELQIAPDPVGEVFFDVTPADARVMIDGETVDTSQTLQLTYGKHQIRVTAEGYETKEGYITIKNAYKIYTIELSGGEASTEEDTNLTTTAASSTAATEAASTTASDVTTTTSTGHKVTIEGPVGAYCYVDGSLKGTVPCSFDKVVGSHIVTFSMSGCLVKSYTITCTDNNKDDTYTFDALQPYDSVLFEEGN